MFRTLRIANLIVMFLSAVLTLAQAAPAKSDTADDWKIVEAAMGRSGSTQPGDVYKFGMPRKDMQVTVEGTPIKAGLALGSWVAFKKMGGEAMVMGDLVLSEDEVEPVMMKLQQGGIEQTALHNHVLHETPRVMYMHIAGHGNAVKLATAIHDALALTKTPGGGPTAPAKATDYGFDTGQVDAILGHKGKDNGGVYQVAVPRTDHRRRNGNSAVDGHGHGDQLPANREREGRDHRRLRSTREGSEPGDPCAAAERY
jgi:hypothetical protein